MTVARTCDLSSVADQLSDRRKPESGRWDRRAVHAGDRSLARHSCKRVVSTCCGPVDRCPEWIPRLRSEGRHDKPAHPHHKDEPQNDKGDKADSKEYRSDRHRDHLHLPVQFHPPFVVRVDTPASSRQGPWPLPAGLRSCSSGVCIRRTSPTLGCAWDEMKPPVRSQPGSDGTR